ncbi:hypothetical protein COU17_03110 [Candidatus Kaiserbacteria bacterium CG10_big_fil_rev_8_21_14_0_10_49_17]|uniref:Uncharacterized protein n=1 Tax=Candidatus Kaiserbacteria bacterium CG10_big_fil_rev_8_21_14_0_10_49_17 TaxID=1974609 RepID=A0A2M6WDP0_9BACT|nr:MAG: hypothetical protein COU17_03110 [Candidatus Kaiserbacteria bacterium CG10_big_fil_rev_8_21_14_0_10_49_17]
MKTVVHFNWASWNEKHFPWFAHLDGMTFPVIGGRSNDRNGTREHKIQLTAEAVELLRSRNFKVTDIQERQCRSRILPHNVLYIPEEFCTNPFE